MGSSGFSQSTYPKVLPPGSRIGDSVYVFSMEQGSEIIRAFVRLDQYHETDSILRNQIDSAKEAFKQFKISEASQREQLAIANERIAKRDALVKAAEDESKAQKKEIRKLKTHKTILGISSGIFAAAAIVLLILL